MMKHSPIFCSGLELGKLAVSSGLLRLSLSKISELHRSIDPYQDSNLRFKIYQEAKYTIVAFMADPFKEDGSVNSEFTLVDGSSDFNPFGFLFSKKISSFSVYSPAFQLFKSAHDCPDLRELQLRSSEKPLIITGSGLGGCVASLFTLWLLDTIEPGRKHPLCITFGSPLIGDTKLQQILGNSIRNSCFLHVASLQDTLPTLLICNSRDVILMPFGSFLLCSESECVCIEDPYAVLELLGVINGGQNFDGKWNAYGKILHHLEVSLMQMGADLPGETVSNRLLAEMFLQPGHMARGRTQDDWEACMINVIEEMENRASQKPPSDLFKKLNVMKINMAYLEWYKKLCRSLKIGYYDHFKSSYSPLVTRVENLKKELTDYWISMVEEAEKKPQKEGAAFRKSFLYAGNNYRRMVEPLDIAEHYRKNSSKNYITSSRSHHYVMLQKWFDKARSCGELLEKRYRFDFLMLDSCFWARVEEARISIGSPKGSGRRDGERGSLTLDKLEEYVWEMIKKHTVSPEIFLEGSSFMKWWEEYKMFKGVENDSAFTVYMNNQSYKQYDTPANT